MRWLIGIDDTDIITSRGTGFHSRQLAHELMNRDVATVHGITRHQLLVDPRIPYTSHNSSACLDVESESFEALLEVSRDFLLEISPEGSDIGLCIVPFEKIGEKVTAWGARAKKEVLGKQEAKEIAKEEGILLEGLCGTHDGIIGALAATGLRKAGNDGRFIWLKGVKELRDMVPGVQRVSFIKENFNIEKIIDLCDAEIQGDPLIMLGEWVRPILKDGRATIIVDKAENYRDYEWKTADKEHIRAIS